MWLGYTAEYPVTIVFLVVEGIALCVVAVLTDWLPLGEYGFVARYLVLFYGLCLLALLVWTQAFRDALPTVQANDKQLVIRGYNEKALSRADWDDVRAWAYQRSTSHGVD